MDALIADLEAAFEDVLAALAKNRDGVLGKYTDLAPPVVAWEPSPDGIPVPVLRAGLARWQDLRAGRAMPDWGDFRTEEFGSIVTRSTIVDPIPGTDDLRYRIFGSRLIETAGRDWEGSTVCDMVRVRRTIGPLLIRAVYRLARERRVPAYTWYARSAGGRVEGVHRLVLPFAVPAPVEVRFMAVVELETAAVPAPQRTAEVISFWPAAAALRGTAIHK